MDYKNQPETTTESKVVVEEEQDHDETRAQQDARDLLRDEMDEAEQEDANAKKETEEKVVPDDLTCQVIAHDNDQNQQQKSQQ